MAIVEIGPGFGVQQVILAAAWESAALLVLETPLQAGVDEVQEAEQP
jgi:hypothetical protein